MTARIENRQHYAEAIVNPDNANHWMTVQPVSATLRVYRGDDLLVETARAVQVVENGRSAYAPRTYFPADDIKVPAEPAAKTTPSRLKGDARYFSHGGEELGWRYDALPFAAVLQDFASLWEKGLRFEYSYA